MGKVTPSLRKTLRYIHGIVVVNRPDLLARAIESTRELWPYSFIVDNSPDGEISAMPWPIRVLRPSVPLSVAQTMNYLHRLAREQDADAFGFQHNDAEAESGSAQRFLEVIEELRTRPCNTWAAAMTLYDILSVYRTAAVDDIGPWDTSFPLPNYHIDKDWFYRAKLRGYEIIETGIPVVHHSDSSSTIKSDDGLRFLNDILVPMNEQYYRRKWGGLPGEETYVQSWNGRHNRR